MRDKVIAQRSLFDQAIDMLVSIFKPNKKLKMMDAIIDANPDIVRLVHADLIEGLQHHGRDGISGERVLRSAILKQWKGYSYFILILFRISPLCKNRSKRFRLRLGIGSMPSWWNMPKRKKWKKVNQCEWILQW